MNSYTALLYNEVNAVVLILLLIVLHAMMHNENVKKSFPSGGGFVISLIGLTVGDILWAFVNSNIIPFTQFWGYFTNIVYFAGTLASVYYLFMVYQDILGYHGDYLKKSVLVAIPFVIDTVFMLLTPITNLVFFYEGDVYHRGPLYAVCLCVPYAFTIYLCIASLVQSFMARYFVIRRSLRIMCMYSVGTLALSFFQLISTQTFPLYVVGGALICVVIYIDILKSNNTMDAVTKIHNSRSFENYLSDLMKKGCAPEKNIYIILADMDDFKSINGIYGHDEGDRVLVEAAKLIQKSTPTGWFNARFGGDEFAMLGVCSPEEIDYICSHISATFDEYNYSSAKPYTVTVSVAYAAKPWNCKSVTEFIRYAEKRLDEASIRARNSLKAVKKARKEQLPEEKKKSESAPIAQQDINLWMEPALKNGEFVPYFQPQIDAEKGTISGAEALVRWIHPEKGILSPGIFIPVFERNGFIYEMDKCLWRSVCAMIRKWKDAGMNIPPVSVNVSRWDIVQSDFTDVLTSYLTEFKLQPSDLRLEITESAYLYDQDYLMRLMEMLQGLGFEIEMDDFGTGYSSLTAFKDLPFNLIKLDASLIRESTKTDKAKRILESIVRMAESMDIPLIAEGIEYKEQADFLKRIGCCNMQGYLFAKPMPEEKFTEFVAEWNKK